jgi:hypothetical protein
VKGLVRDFSAKRDRADVDTVIKDMPAFRGGAEISAVADFGHDHHFRLACLQSIHPPSISRPNHTPEVPDRQTMIGAFMQARCSRRSGFDDLQPFSGGGASRAFLPV